MDHSIRASTSSASSARVVDVLVPVALNQTYSYRVPRGMDVAPGDVVCVPLGPREAVAVVWAENANPDPRLHNRLKDVSEKLDVPPLQEELRALVDWVANYTLSARGMVLRMCLRMGEHLGPERVRMGVRLIGAPPSRMTPARRRLIELLSDGLLHGKSEAAKEAGVSAGVIDGLVDEGTLMTEAMPRAPAPPAPDPSFSAPEFSRQMRENRSILIQLNAEQPAWKLFDYRSGDFNTVFFTHLPPEISLRIRIARASAQIRYRRVYRRLRVFGLSHYCPRRCSNLRSERVISRASNVA